MYIIIEHILVGRWLRLKKKRKRKRKRIVYYLHLHNNRVPKLFLNCKVTSHYMYFSFRHYYSSNYSVNDYLINYLIVSFDCSFILTSLQLLNIFLFILSQLSYDLIDLQKPFKIIVTNYCIHSISDVDFQSE